MRTSGSIRASDSFACIGADTGRVGDSEACVYNAISIFYWQYITLYAELLDRIVQSTFP